MIIHDEINNKDKTIDPILKYEEYDYPSNSNFLNLIIHNLKLL